MVTIRTKSETDENGDGPSSVPHRLVEHLLEDMDNSADMDIPSSSFSDSAQHEPDANISDDNMDYGESKDDLIHSFLHSSGSYPIGDEPKMDDEDAMERRISENESVDGPLLNHNAILIRETLLKSQQHTIATHTPDDADSGSEDVANSIIEDAVDLPEDVLERLKNRVFTKQWSIPLLEHEELQQLLNCACHLVVKGTDRSSRHFDDFMQCMKMGVAPRLMCDDALRGWAGSVHVNIWHIAAKFMRLFAEKLRRAEEDETLLDYFVIARYFMCRENMYHKLNEDRPAPTNAFVQIESDVIQRYLEYHPQDMRQHGKRHLGVLSKFAEHGGFEALKVFLDARVPACQDINYLNTWLSLLLELHGFAKPELMKTLGEVSAKHAFEVLQQVLEKELKCDSVDQNFDVPPLFLMRVVQSILLGYKGLMDEEEASMSRALDFKQLSCFLRVIQMAKFAGRLRGLDELRRVFIEKAKPQESERPIGIVFLGMDIHALIQWSRDNDLIALLLRDNLHQPTYVERIERVLMVFIEMEQFTEADLDTLWTAQIGKHDAIQRNLHMLIAKLSKKFPQHMVDMLLHRYFATWKTASMRERVLLLDLMLHLLEESDYVYRRDLHAKCIDLLWQILLDDSMPMDKAQLEMLLSRQLCVFENMQSPGEVAEAYVDKCVDVIRERPRLAVFAIRHLEKLIPIALDNHFDKREPFLRLLNKHQLVTLLCQDLHRYVQAARQFLRAHPEVDTSQSRMVVVDGIESHQEHLRTRMRLVNSIVTDVHTPLTSEQVKILWDSLVEDPAVPDDRKHGFSFFFEILRKSEQTLLIHEDAVQMLINECMLKLDVSCLDSQGLDCFMAANCKPFDTCKGYFHYMWEAVLNGTNEVSLQATRKIIDESATKAMGLDDARRSHTITSFIDNCFQRIDSVYQELLLSGDASTDEVADANATRIARIIRVLSWYVDRWSEFWRADGLPLGKAAMGRCYMVRLHVTSDDLETAVPTSNNFRSRSYSITHTNKYDDLEVSIPVHDNMIVKDLKKKVARIIVKHMKNGNNPDVSPFLLELVLAITESQARDVLNELSWRRAGKNGLRTLTRNMNGDTLRDVGVGPDAFLTVQFRQQFKRMRANDDSPQSSTESSNMSDVTESDEDAESTRVPGVVIASSQERMERIFKLYDMGCSLSHDTLKRESHTLLSLLPLSSSVMKLLEESTDAELRELFEREAASQSKTIFLLEAIDALLMPAHVSDAHSIKFRQNFILKGGAQQLLALFTQHLDLSRWCIEFRVRAFELLARIVRYTCSVVAVIKKSLLADDDTLLMSLKITEKVPYKHEQFYKDSVAMLAKAIKASVKMPNLMERIDSFRVEQAHIYGILMVAWAAAVGEMGAVKSFSQIRQDFREHVLARSQPEMLGLIVENNPWQLGLFKDAMDALALCSVFCQNFDSLFDGYVSGCIGLCDVAVDVMLQSPVPAIRNHMSKLFPYIIEHCAINCPPGDEAAIVQKITQRASLLVNKFFGKLEDAAARWQQCSQFFDLLCTAVSICADNHVPIDDFAPRLKHALSFLSTAKTHTTSHCEPYPKDDLLVGYLDLIGSLVPLLPLQDKQRLGSPVEGGMGLIRDLLHCFILPHSKAYVELSRLEKNSIVAPPSLEASPASGVQRSASTNAVYPALVVGSPDLRSIPRSATAPLLANPIVPVCGSEASVKATYDLIVALSFDCQVNLKIVLDELTNLFYSVQPQRLEWEYSPNFIPRAPSNYVGLKNAGATCYMNSIFQQLFTIRPLCQSIINAKCEDVTTLDGPQTSSDDNELPLLIGPDPPPIDKDKYPVAVLRTVQTIFAHLIGSKVQYYVPRQFWDTFMFNGSHMNPREQQDALEFFNAVADVIDEGMKKVHEPPVFEKLFGGTFADQKICKDCPHRYEREEAFTSISVDVRSHNNLLDSMKEYVKGDLLDNDNAYLCEQCDKKVAAVKRLCIKTLPPYMVIQLKRFDFDWEREVAVKHNDYFEFPLEIDMEPYTADGLAKADAEHTNGGQYSPLPGENLSSMEDVSVPPLSTTFRSTSEDSLRLSMQKSLNPECLYRLRGVLVHSGEANGGHYYSFIRGQPDEKRQEGWFKFDDTDVSEWEITKEEMQNAWFGGDYLTDGFDVGKFMSKKRSKRRWNAYLLFYEKANINDKLTPNRLDVSMDSTSGTYKPLSPNSNMVSMGRRFGSMNLNGTPFTVQMPAPLEQLIQLKNLKFLHERSQYAPQYFKFVHALCKSVAEDWSEKSAKNPDIHQDPTQTFIVLWATSLMSQFLFRTCLRAKSDLRDAINLRTLASCYRVFLSSDRTVREWFFKNILLSHELIFNFLVDAPMSETREFFATVLHIFLQEAREDDLSTVDLSSMGFNGTFFRDDRTITDSVLRLLTLVPRNHFNDFLRQPREFFDLAMRFVKESLDNRKRFINVGALGILLTLIGREDHRTRSVCSEFPVIFDIIYFLLAACCIAPEQEASTSTAAVPDARRVAVFAPPAEVHEWITDAQNVQRLIRLLLEHASEDLTVRNIICLLCRDNMLTTKKVFAHLHFDSCQRILMTNQREQHNFLTAFRELMQLKDSHQPQRILLGVLGDDRIKGLMQVLLGMRERYTQPQKALQLLHEFAIMYDGIQAMRDVLSNDTEFVTAFLEMTDWLSRQVDAKDQRGPAYRFNNRTILDREKANEILNRCQLICDQLRNSAAFQLVQEPIEVTDTEEDEGVQMDDYAPPTMVVPPTVVVPPLYNTLHPAINVLTPQAIYPSEDVSMRTIDEDAIDPVELPSAADSGDSSPTDDENAAIMQCKVEMDNTTTIGNHMMYLMDNINKIDPALNLASDLDPRCSPPHENNAKKRDSQHFDAGSPPPYDSINNQPKSKVPCQEGGVIGPPSESSVLLVPPPAVPCPSYEEAVSPGRVHNKSPAASPARASESQPENGTLDKRQW